MTQTLTSIGAADPGIARNDLLRMTAYPDATPGWSTLGVNDWANLTVDQWAALTADPTGDVTQPTYNRLGEPATFTDQRGTTRTFVRKALTGRVQFF